MEMENRSNSMNHFKRWSELELREFADKLAIQAIESPDQGFSISRSRLHGSIDQLQGDDPSETPSKLSTIYGVVGTIRLLSGTHVLVITSKKEVGAYLGFPVFVVTSMEKFLSSNERSDEAYFMNLLKIVESTRGLYYSYEMDITFKEGLNWQKDG